MKKSKPNIFFVILFLCVYNMNLSETLAQRPGEPADRLSRIFIFKDAKISYLATSNRFATDLTLPGMKVCIIVGEPDQPVESVFNSDGLRTVRFSNMGEYTCFYYLPYSAFPQGDDLKDFLKQFIDFNYRTDHFNRNKVFLIWKNHTVDLADQTAALLHPVIAAIGVPPSGQYRYKSALVFGFNDQDISFLTETYTTSLSYDILSLPEIDEHEQQVYAHNLVFLKNSFFFKLTFGQNNIGSPNRTEYDQATLVDFSDHKLIWNIQTGYYVTDRFAPFVGFGIIYAGKSQGVTGVDVSGDNIVVSGSGSGGAMLRYSYGLRVVPYKRERFNTFLDVMSGGVNVIAKGGSGTVTVGSGNTTDIVTMKEKSHFYSLSGGFNCRLSNFFYLTSNLAYDISPLKAPIGSVTSFTGLSINAGIGFMLSFKKSRH